MASELRSTHPGIVALRAIAVLSVVIFHFAPSTLPGGFVGVDIFFVISGYLISRTIYADLGAGQFSFAAFYERRARRILPAFVAVSLVTTLAAFFILLPHAFAEYAKTLLAAALFVPNLFYYWTADYFAPAAGEIPLLHYWSLGVEEQFYLLFPVLVWALFRWVPKAIAPILALLLVASLVSSEFALRNSPPAAFYLPWNRAFELLVGSLLALPRVWQAGPRLGMAATIVGLAVLAASLALITESSPFPGIIALVPCFGAALMIWGASPAASPTVGRVLASRPFAFFSDISYSLYLVHWPIAVMGVYVFPGSPPFGFALGGIAASVALGALSYVLVEQEFRTTRRQFWTRPRMFTASAVGVLIVCFMSGTIVLLQGFPDRISGRMQTLLATLQYDHNPAFQTSVCFMQPTQDFTDYDVNKCIPPGRPLAILWGDSHLAQYLYGLRPLFNEQGYAIGQFGGSGCAPVLDVDSAIRPKCRAFSDFAIKEIIALKPELVVLGAIWTGTDEQLAGLGRSVRALQAAGIKFAVVGNSPRYKDAVPTILANRLLAGNTSTLSDEDLDAAFVTTSNAAVQDYVAGLPDVTFISIYDLVCGAGGCPLEIDGRPLHFDRAHQTADGSNYYASILFPHLLPLP